ncbi:MAG: hypothetical protein CL489_08450 [Acidobacteria bacterium]|nr:hypothetical protein [Acidobacteriota bacterium]|tara:strand:- start:53721 stop:53963 length:243 start_codon:yes stop_codon:yes gene_type:complete
MKNIEIKTSFDPNMIRQTIDVNHGMYKNSQEQIINLSEDGVKQALSKLGYLNKEQALHLTNTVEQLQKDKDILLGEKINY